MSALLPSVALWSVVVTLGCDLTLGIDDFTFEPGEGGTGGVTSVGGSDMGGDGGTPGGAGGVGGAAAGGSGGTAGSAGMGGAGGSVSFTCDDAQSNVTLDATSGHCYVLEQTQLTWQDARAQCLSLGADLAAISSGAEHAFVDDVVDAENVWIGGTDQGDEGNFTWTNGEPWGFVAWAPTQPDNQGGAQHCAFSRPVIGLSNDEWDDLQCTNLAAYLCEGIP